MSSPARVYCAGPLFTPTERDEMQKIALALEEDGYETFLPQRDGLELTKCVEQLVKNGCSPSDAAQLMSEAIFALDVFQVLEGCDVVVANINGRVPDEGTVSEVAMAWARGKVVVGYKTDSRSVFQGQDNPLLTGLFNFILCRSIPEVVSAVTSGISDTSKAGIQKQREIDLTHYTWLGQRIWATLRDDSDLENIATIIMQHKQKPIQKGTQDATKAAI